MARSDLAEEADEGYFASISDLMVGILFVFLLMLTVFALNFQDAQQVELRRYQELTSELEKKKSELEEALRQAADARQRAEEAEREAQRATAAALEKQAENDRFRKLLDEAVAQLERDLNERQNQRAKLLASLEQTLTRSGVVVTVSARSDVLSLSGDVLFRTGRSELETQASRAIVDALADALDKALPCSVAASKTPCEGTRVSVLDTVLVEGHTDKQAYGRATGSADARDLNDELSTQRALTVSAALRQRRPDLESLTNEDGLKLLAFSGYGSRRPRPDSLGDSPADFQRNRRIDVRFVLSTRTSEELQRLRDQIRQALGGGAP